ncbi:hypothetical protein [Chitinophaga sp. S165]|uniref:hypothetical protein n=1 Tax=Chitinophaga sp. S165 TaxID=2135462 RepID=UPI000D70DFE7|nr:hypothetical protein [Chitinophaga sp. S165]PWV55656.1 hypothetical protein C7475_101162 [Chitinophaga sp. S165]
MDVDNILFNDLKHHRKSIHWELEGMTLDSLPHYLKVLGNSQMDIYYGDLTKAAIYIQILNAIKQAGVTDEPSYLQWLKDNGGYAEITLSDTSRWILLHGIEPNKYIHLHPARYSPHSMRVKATILKTAIACLVAYPDGAHPDLASLNHIRRNILGLSPVKDLDACEHLWQVIAMLNAY